MCRWVGVWEVEEQSERESKIGKLSKSSNKSIGVEAQKKAGRNVTKKMKVSMKDASGTFFCDRNAHPL